MADTCLIFPNRSRSVLFASVFLALIIVPVPAQDIRSLNSTRKQLEDEIAYTSSLLEQTKKKKETSLKDLQLLNRNIEKRETLIKTIGEEILEVDRQITAGNLQVEKFTGELTALKEEYARMIYFAYLNINSQNRLLFIFSADNFSQAYNRIKYYQQYSEYRRKQAEKILKAQNDLNLALHELEEIKGQKLMLSETEQSETEKLSHEKQVKNKTVRDLSKKEGQLLSTLQSKQLALSKLQAEIERVIAEAARSREAGSAAAADLTLSTSFASNKGRLPWPSGHGVVTSTFGEHPHPVLKYVKVDNKGIDIMVSEGTEVKAVFDGTISRIVAIPNLNKVVMIRHGEYLTVYTNLGDVFVSDGTAVSTGQVIGKAYFDKDEGKSEINFQVWHGKTIEDPQQWLRQ
jgi:septal ring factor EnvC (AmiA/AmiB activator)